MGADLGRGGTGGARGACAGAIPEAANVHTIAAALAEDDAPLMCPETNSNDRIVQQSLRTLPYHHCKTFDQRLAELVGKLLRDAA